MYLKYIVEINEKNGKLCYDRLEKSGELDNMQRDFNLFFHPNLKLLRKNMQ